MQDFGDLPSHHYGICAVADISSGLLIDPPLKHLFPEPDDEGVSGRKCGGSHGEFSEEGLSEVMQCRLSIDPYDTGSMVFDPDKSLLVVRGLCRKHSGAEQYEKGWQQETHIDIF
jgi:hypothetical protein